MIQGYLNMNKEALGKMINDTRHALMNICIAIYKYVGKCIDDKELKDSADAVLSPEMIELFTHQYILKDVYSDITTFDSNKANFSIVGKEE